MESQTLPTQTDLLGRYQTALDNDLYKAIRCQLSWPVSDNYLVRLVV